MTKEQEELKNKEILLRAIKIAIMNGCSYSFYHIDTELWLQKKLYYSVIFDHEFCKSIFHEFIGQDGMWQDGERLGGFTKSGWPIAKRDWRYHIKEMALSPEPLKYIERFLDEQAGIEKIY